ncbi:DEKNAAC105302 [Brettanomyces naardenensis]|uniref:DEKNAAC105302 n=1 Tax=Brettanomyces naardenensis TaxID=13370 RepID=A0A448YT46_BRENA|nr:DEKNAAC105302 [Brettanomyces naardenensis]
MVSASRSSKRSRERRVSSAGVEKDLRKVSTNGEIGSDLGGTSSYTGTTGDIGEESVDIDEDMLVNMVKGAGKNYKKFISGGIYGGDAEDGDDERGNDERGNGEKGIDENGNEVEDADFDPYEEDYEEEYTFDMDPEGIVKNRFDPFEFHKALFKYLRIVRPQTEEKGHQDLMWQLFSCTAALSDPYTQPSDTGEMNEMILSLDLVSDLVLAICLPLYEKDPTVELPEFAMAYDFATIVERALHVVRSDDDSQLMAVNNDEEHWLKSLSMWVPGVTLGGMFNMASDYHHLKLVYTICCVSIMVIYKLYASTENVCLNPFLSFFLQVWKNQTRVIVLGIEIDRRDESSGFPGYPEVIRQVIKGSSALRSAVALILNDDLVEREHDFKHESLVNFMNPWGRRIGDASISADMRIYVAALFALGDDLEDTAMLLYNFEAEDRYDEDIKYMFELELEDDPDDVYQQHHEKFTFALRPPRPPKHSAEEEVDLNSEGEPFYDLHPDCQCVFDEEDEYEDEDEEEEEERGEIIKDERRERKDGRKKRSEQPSSKSSQRFDPIAQQVEKDRQMANDLQRQELGEAPTGDSAGYLEDIYDRLIEIPEAVRSRSPNEPNFDEEGRDWRDIPRGENRKLTEEFVALLKKSRIDPDVFITVMKDLIGELQKMANGTLASEQCEKIIRSVAWVVQYEYESSRMSKSAREGGQDDSTINTDTLYQFLSEDGNFRKMVRFNPSSSFCIIDELLMAEGYRRVFIWFLTHMAPNQWIINYFHELLIGNRGNPSEISDPKSTRFSFSRQGPIELSEVEESMLLHEFFTTMLVYLSRGSVTGDFDTLNSTRSSSQKLMKVTCLMLKSLDQKGILRVNDAFYRLEIQTLLVQWLGVGLVPEARELFFKSQKFNPNEDRLYEMKRRVMRRRVEMDTVLKDKELYDLFASHFERDSTELVVGVLQLGNYYDEKRDAVLSFLKDLNKVEKVFKTSASLVRICDYVFPLLGVAIEGNSIRLVTKFLKEAKLADTDKPVVRDAIKAYLEIPESKRRASELTENGELQHR